MSDTLTITAPTATVTVTDVRTTVRASTTTGGTLDIAVAGLSGTLSNDGSVVLVSAPASTTLAVSVATDATVEIAGGGRGPRGIAGPAGEGGSTTVTAGADLSGHRVVRPQEDGTVIYASNDDLADAGRALWLTLGAALTGTDVSVQMVGLVVEPTWAWTDSPVYLGTSGSLTQTPPVAPAAAFLVQVGSPDGPASLFYDPRTPIAL